MAPPSAVQNQHALYPACDMKLGKVSGVLWEGLAARACTRPRWGLLLPLRAQLDGVPRPRRDKRKRHAGVRSIYRECRDTSCYFGRI